MLKPYNYAITDLETLAVSRVTYFCYCVYGHDTTIMMDYGAVKSILGAPNLTKRHARWRSDAYDKLLTYLITAVRRTYMLTVSQLPDEVIYTFGVPQSITIRWGLMKGINLRELYKHYYKPTPINRAVKKFNRSLKMMLRVLR